MSNEIRSTRTADAAPELEEGLDAGGQKAARRGWMRRYLRSSVKSRLADLEELTEAELNSLRAAKQEEPAP
jgi:hypothetical protein